MTEKGLRRDINYREQFFDRDNHWLSETIATYAQVFGRHHISAMAGFTADFKRLHSREVYSRGYPDNDINSSIWDQANDWTSNTPKESKYEQTMVSFLARLGYSFDDRYFLVGSVRRDASSKRPRARTTTGSPRYRDRGNSRPKNSSGMQASTRFSTWSSSAQAGAVSVMSTSIRTTWQPLSS